MLNQRRFKVRGLCGLRPVAKWELWSGLSEAMFLSSSLVGA